MVQGLHLPLSSAPALEINTIIFKHVYWYMQQISGERLQDHWSSSLRLFSEMLKPKGDIIMFFLRCFRNVILKKAFSESTEKIWAWFTTIFGLNCIQIPWYKTHNLAIDRK